MPDMFGRETVLGGVMSAEATRINFSNVTNNAGLIMQQLQLEYKQNVTRLYALEDAKVYFVAGRTEGVFTVQHVVGPQGLLKAFIEKYGDVCKIGDEVLKVGTFVGCGTSNDVATPKDTKPSSIILKAPVLTAFGLQMQAGNMVIASTLTGMFVSMEIEEAGGNQNLLIDLSTADIGAEA